MRWKPHVRFGERAGETDQLRSRHRAPVRLHLAGHKLDLCRQRVQQDTLGHRGRTGDPLYGVRRALRTRDGLLTERQWTRIATVFADDTHAAVEATWCAYQQLIDAYAQNDPQRGKTLLATLIDLLRTGLPAGLEELAQLGRTLHRRRDDVLAYFTHRASNGPTEAIVSSPVPEERRVGRALGDVLLMQ